MKIIYTGYRWRPMTPPELEIICVEKILEKAPDEPEAGDILEVSGWLGANK